MPSPGRCPLHRGSLGSSAAEPTESRERVTGRAGKMQLYNATHQPARRCTDALRWRRRSHEIHTIPRSRSLYICPPTGLYPAKRRCFLSKQINPRPLAQYPCPSLPPFESRPPQPPTVAAAASAAWRTGVQLGLLLSAHVQGPLPNYNDRLSLHD